MRMCCRVKSDFQSTTVTGKAIGLVKSNISTITPTSHPPLPVLQNSTA